MSLDPQVATVALESFVKLINDQGNMKAEILKNVVVGDEQYVELKYTMIKPVENIIIDFEIIK